MKDAMSEVVPSILVASSSIAFSLWSRAALCWSRRALKRSFPALLRLLLRHDRARDITSDSDVLRVVAAFVVVASFPSFAALHHRLLHVVLLTSTTLAILRETESRVSPW